MEQPLSLLTAAEQAQFEDILDLQPGEQLVRVLRRTKVSYFLPHIISSGIFWVVMLILYSTIFVGLQRLFPLDVLNTLFAIYLIVIIIWAIAFPIILAVGTSFVSGHIYFVTTRKLVLYRQFVRILFREIEFKRITDLVLRQGLWGRLANFGTLFPVTAGVEFNIRGMEVFSIEGVKDVFEVRKLVMLEIKKIQDELRKRYKAGAGTP